MYESKYYPGQVTKVLNNGMTPYGKQWKWLSRKEEIFYISEEIVMAIKESAEPRGYREIFVSEKFKFIFIYVFVTIYK